MKDTDLAYFKIGSILDKLMKLPVFGTGFPTNVARELPRTEITDDYVIYYDKSGVRNAQLSQI